MARPLSGCACSSCAIDTRRVDLPDETFDRPAQVAQAWRT
jgi:hypothetical protein